MLRSSALVLVVLTACGDPRWLAGDGEAPPVEEPPANDDGALPLDPLEGMGPLVLVDEGYRFLEGPRWVPALGALLFSDVQASTIYRLDPPHGVSIYRQPSGYANGLALDLQGRLLVCEHQTRSLSRESSPGIFTPVVDRFQNARLNSPNDVVVRSDGTVYFTDPPYATPSNDVQLTFAGVFRVSTLGTLSAEWRGALSARPNGLVLSPDEHTLYVADTAAQQVLAFDVASSGALSEPRVFSREACAGDGMAIDRGGNVYVGCTGERTGVLVLAPSGETWGFIETDDGVTNVGFGDDARTLYLTTPHALYRVRLSAIGVY